MRRLLLLGLVLFASAWGASARPQETKAPSPAAMRLTADADQIVSLARDLEAAVEKTNEHTLSLDVIRKAEDIERFAKKFKADGK